MNEPFIFHPHDPEMLESVTFNLPKEAKISINHCNDGVWIRANCARFLRIKRWLAVCLLLLAAPLSANDGSAGLDASGLILKKNGLISMEKEDLFISRKKIRVTYLFRNPTDEDIETTIAFPVHEGADAEMGDQNYDLSKPNPLDFTVEVEGKKVPFQLERKTVPNPEDPNESLHQLTYYWTQVFPKHSVLEIRHSYTPAPEIFFLPSEGQADKAWLSLYCVEPRLFSKANPSSMGYALRYILTTANTWKGPIGDFQLTLQKEGPSEIVSLCFDGIRKISPTLFEVRKKDFTPSRELDVLWAETKR